MRYDVKKFLFIGPEEEKAAFFKQAQKAGIVDFIKPSAKSKQAPPLQIQQIIQAIKILRELTPTEQEEFFASLDADAIVQQILSLKHRCEQLLEQQRVLNLEIARIKVFGNFSMEDIAYIEKEGQCVVQFFCCKEGTYHEKPLPESLIYIETEHNLDYFTAINPKRVTYDNMVEIVITKSLENLVDEYNKSETDLHQLTGILKSFAKYNTFLHSALAENLNRHHLNTAQAYSQEALEGAIFAIEGWVPANKMAELQQMTNQLRIHSEEIAIETNDAIPTFLENTGASRIGEDLVRIYDTPSFTDKDPSMWVLSAFALFFAFIIGDAGYGLIYLAIALFIRYKNPNIKGVGRRVLNLFTILSVGCIIWGTLTTSFFGMQIAYDNPIRKISLIGWLVDKKAAYHMHTADTTYKELVKQFPGLNGVSDSHIFVATDNKIFSRFNDNVMFELALFVGVLHLILSMLRYASKTFSNIGWIIFLIGSYLYFPYYFQTPALPNYVGGLDLEKGGELGLLLIIVGLIFAWGASIYQNGWKGLFEITTVIQIVADTLSYLRLYALGLAGAIFSATFNEIAAGAPLFLGVLIVILVHAFNIVLGTMSGVIHGLRLNFLEWYHYSFEGGGKEFNPLKLLKTPEK